MKYFLVIISLIIFISCQKKGINQVRSYNVFSKKIDFTKKNNELLYTIKLRKNDVKNYQTFKLNKQERLKELNFSEITFQGQFIKTDTIYSEISIIDTMREDSILLEIKSKIELGKVQVQNISFDFVKSVIYTVKHDTSFKFDVHPFLNYFFSGDYTDLEKIKGKKHYNLVDKTNSNNDTLSIALITAYKINGNNLFTEYDMRSTRIVGAEKIDDHFIHLGLSSKDNYREITKYAKVKDFGDDMILPIKNSTNSINDINIISKWYNNE